MIVAAGPEPAVIEHVAFHSDGCGTLGKFDQMKRGGFVQ